jgi:hypothetical protein
MQDALAVVAMGQQVLGVLPLTDLTGAPNHQGLTALLMFDIETPDSKQLEPGRDIIRLNKSSHGRVFVCK